MRLFRKLPLFLFIAMITSCQQDGKQLHIASMQDIKEWILPEYSLKSRHIRDQIYQLAQEAPAMYADAFTIKYYKAKGHFVWITRHGIDEKADTLLSYLRNVEEEGFNASSFFVSKIGQPRRHQSTDGTIGIQPDKSPAQICHRTALRLYPAFARSQQHRVREILP